jgi:hypothetical protein
MPLKCGLQARIARAMNKRGPENAMGKETPGIDGQIAVVAPMGLRR